MEKIASSSTDIYGWLANPVWNPLNVLIQIITAVAAYVIGQKKSEKKELSYILISDTSVVSINKSFADVVEVRYLNMPAKTLQSIKFKIINTGNKEIREDDFAEPLTFVDLKKAKDRKSKPDGFYLVNFPEKSPKDLKPEPYEYNGRLGIKPLLLNTRESITIELLNIDVRVQNVKIDVSVRINGGKLKELQPTYLQQLTFLETSIVVGIIGVMAGLTSGVAVYSELINVGLGVLIPFITIVISIPFVRSTKFFIKPENSN